MQATLGHTICAQRGQKRVLAIIRGPFGRAGGRGDVRGRRILPWASL